MQMSDAAKVVQVFGTDTVNKHLEQGWQLLAVVASTYGDRKDNVLLPCYILGKPKAPVLSPSTLVGKATLKQ
ncbi:hypothetical protein [Pseudomonas fulva]|uniref:hypothetical protein n=1 Tax=Pseudomonas fulva TaxID=47880 RepID=UPI0018A8F8C2|nr:hypothetical protein [Pseudomonas fulva]MBF8694934.1 hypothetical protein [Pseudomonas fulva]